MPKPGRLPYMSPIRVTVTEPTTIPARKNEPIRPISIDEAHSKLNWMIRLSIVSLSSQTSSYLISGLLQNSADPHRCLVPSGMTHLYFGSTSRKGKLYKKHCESDITRISTDAFIF